MSPENVSAVVVTRGDVDLGPVLDSLIFDDVVVWNNATDGDEMTYARVLATKRARHSVIYSQDDDLVHTPDNQRRIVEAYEPGVLTGCMWLEWSDGARRQGIEGGYRDLVFPGSGSVYDAAVAWEAVAVYLAHYPADAFFRLWCDTIVGTLAETRSLDIRFEALPWAEDASRMANLDDAVALKREAMYRGRWVREMARLAGAL